MEILEDEKEGPYLETATPLPNGQQDPFAFLTKVIKEDLKIDPFDVSALENNRVVMQILEAAKIAAETGKTVRWEELY